ncbi:MAG: barstar family protein [Lachnospiraceae bacterium]|nr:barstar family protein [Lachnospiraceae bacterium]
MKKIILDGEQLCDRETAHAYLQEAFGLPEYYGKNLDALYDCLTELQDVYIEIQKPKEESMYFKKVLRVFRGAEMESDSLTVVVNEM